MSFLAKVPKLIWELLGFVIIGLLIVFWLNRHDNALLERAKDQAKVNAIDSTNTGLGHRGDSVQVVYRDRYHTYTEVRDTALAHNPTDKPLQDVVKACNQVVLTCQQRAAIADSLTRSQASEIKLLKGMKAATVPRLSLFGEAMYDLANKNLLGRAGVDFRIAGPLSITGAIEAAPNKTDNSTFQSRALAGLRFTFR